MIYIYLICYDHNRGSLKIQTIRGLTINIKLMDTLLYTRVSKPLQMIPLLTVVRRVDIFDLSFV